MFRAKSVTRAHVITAVTLLHARCTNICYDLACISFFSGKSFTVFLESQPPSTLIHSFNKYFFVHYYAADTVLTAEEIAVNKTDKIKISALTEEFSPSVSGREDSTPYSRGSWPRPSQSEEHISMAVVTGSRKSI